MCKVLVPIFERVGYLDSFGVLRGHALAPIMFYGTSEDPTIFYVEVPCVAHARFFMDYYLASKRSKRGSGLVK